MKKALSYVGKKAADYDKKREGSNKWKRENEAVESLLHENIYTVVDIPCGTGRFFDLYNKRKLIYTGIDVSRDMLQQATKKHPEANLEQGDIRNLGKSIRYFDCAVCCRLTAWLDPGDLDKAIKELLRIANTVIVGIRFVYDDNPIQKGKLWIHSEKYFMSCIKKYAKREIKLLAYSFGKKKNDKGQEVEYLFVRIEQKCALK